jgi:ABC-2 type transport system ATP-binding protein
VATTTPAAWTSERRANGPGDRPAILSRIPPARQPRLSAAETVGGTVPVRKVLGGIPISRLETMPDLAQFDGVAKFYGTHQALGPVTLTLPDASVGLLGPNGAGKSTFLRLLLGMVPPTSGTVRVLGEEVQGAASLRGKVGYAPEGDAQFPGLTGVEAVTYAGRLVGMPRVDALSRTHQVLDYVGLGEERYRRVGNYSTGMRQKLKLAQALVHDPQLLVLDEPTEGVDPEARLQLLDVIAELQREHGMRVLVSTHLLHDAERLVEHTVVLDKGRVAMQGPLAQLKKAAAPAYVLRVQGSAEPVEQALTAAGLRWQAQAPAIRVETDDPRALLTLVQRAGLVVRHLAPAEVTLEDAFAQAVGGEAHA